MRFSFGVLLTVSLLSGCAGGAAYHRDFMQQEYYLAEPGLQDMARDGDPQSQMELGYLYQYGLRVPRDEARARQLYQRAIDQGFLEAQLFLGVLDMEGTSVPPDYARALELFRAADERGDPRGAFNLAQMYWYGVGVPTDRKAAAEFTKRYGQALNATFYNMAIEMRRIIEMSRRYPQSAVHAAHYGKVIVKFVVSHQQVESSEVLYSSGYQELDQAALDAVNGSSFDPPPPGMLTPDPYIMAFNFQL